MTTDTLAAFVAARLAERGAEANRLQCALDAGWNYFDEPGDYDAARMLREVAFGRALLADWLDGVGKVGDGLSVRPRSMVVAYAAIWSGHPDYEQAATCSHTFYDYGGDRRCVTCGTVVKAARQTAREGSPS